MPKYKSKLVRFIQKVDTDRGLFLASGLAFDFLVCFIPFLMVLSSLLGHFLFSAKEVAQHLQDYLSRVIPFASGKITHNILQLVKDRKVIGALGFFGLIWTSTRLFASLRTVLSIIYGSENRRGILHGKLTDILMVFLIGLLFVFSILLTLFINLVHRFSKTLSWNLPFGIAGWGAWGVAVSIFITLTMFFLIYKTLPDKSVSFKLAGISALFSTILWEALKTGFGYYVHYFGRFMEIYGSFGLMVLFFFWIYYSALTFILGAEVGWIWGGEE